MKQFCKMLRKIGLALLIVGTLFGSVSNEVLSWFGLIWQSRYDMIWVTLRVFCLIFLVVLWLMREMPDIFGKSWLTQLFRLANGVVVAGILAIITWWFFPLFVPMDDKVVQENNQFYSLALEQASHHDMYVHKYRLVTPYFRQIVDYDLENISPKINEGKTYEEHFLNKED